MHNLFYFRHYITELQNPNIAAIFKRYGAKGYGFYWHILERLYAEESSMIVYDKKLIADLAKATKMSRLKVKMILADMESLRLISFRGDHICSTRVDGEIESIIKAKNRKIAN